MKVYKVRRDLVWNMKDYIKKKKKQISFHMILTFHWPLLAENQSWNMPMSVDFRSDSFTLSSSIHKLVNVPYLYPYLSAIGIIISLSTLSYWEKSSCL